MITVYISRLFFIYRFQLAFESFLLLSNYTKASDVFSTI